MHKATRPNLNESFFISHDRGAAGSDGLLDGIGTTTALCGGSDHGPCGTTAHPGGRRLLM